MVKGKLFLAMFFFACVQAGEAKIIFYDDCEDGPSTSDYKLLGADPVNQPFSILAANSEHARMGAKSYKMYLPPLGSDCGPDGCESSSDKRTELRIIKPICSGLANFCYNTEFWLGYSVYIPNNFVLPNNSDGEWLLCSQFHAEAGDTVDGVLCDSQNTNPTAPFHFKGAKEGMWDTYIQAEVDKCSDKVRDRNQSYSNIQWKRGQWNDIVIHMKWDYRPANNPFFKAWVNHIQYVNDSGINCWNDSRGPYWKIGLYGMIPRSGNTIWLDEIRLGDQSSSYNEVFPGGSSSATPPSAPVGLTAK